MLKGHCFGSDDKSDLKSWLGIWSYLLWALNHAEIWNRRKKERSKLPDTDCSDYERERSTGRNNFWHLIWKPQRPKRYLSLFIQSANIFASLFSALSCVSFRYSKPSSQPSCYSVSRREAHLEITIQNADQDMHRL